MAFKIVRVVAIVFAVVLLSLLFLYFVNFNGALSHSQHDWAAFGGYIGGIAAVANVIVFIWLTKTIEDNHSRKHDAELHLQIKLLLAKIRYERVKEVNDKLHEIRVNLHSDNLMTILDETKRLFIESIESSALFVNDDGDNFFLMMASKFEEIHSKLNTNSHSSVSPEYIKLKEELFKETFRISSGLEIFIIGQIYRPGLDGVAIYLCDALEQIHKNKCSSN